MSDPQLLEWVPFAPQLAGARANALIGSLAQKLIRVTEENLEECVETVRTDFLKDASAIRTSENQALIAAGMVLADLAVQGWEIRKCGNGIEVRPPQGMQSDVLGEKARIRRQELIKRDAQLRRPSVRTFVQAMERGRVFNGQLVSIFSLMRDGGELAERLKEIRSNPTAELNHVVDPYLQFVDTSRSRCAFTGLRLMDIWRYFRHTWSNQYTSVPGRTMLFLVRDRAASYHPIIGIGALSSPIVQIRERDEWVGWHPDEFLRVTAHQPTKRLAKWLMQVVDSAIDEVYVDDLLRDGILQVADLQRPRLEVVAKLRDDSAKRRRLHHRFVSPREHKKARPTSLVGEHWRRRAETHLFRSKRSLALATLLEAKALLNEALPNKSRSELARFLATSEGMQVVRKVLKKAKADRVGICVADITVCGAVQPYNAILGGKLVAMLAASPEVVIEYKKRYDEAESEIASSMAGRPVRRKPVLVLLGTTSLYGIGSSQYNRVRIPCSRIGGALDDIIEFKELGHSRAFGTSQYSEETVEALGRLVEQAMGGTRVNSIFGEGVSPKLRKVRQGLDVLGLPSEIYLQHHRRRVVYVVSLIRNVRDYLIGLDSRPEYLFSLKNCAQATNNVAAWWSERWLRKRISSDEVLAQIANHTLKRPISHGARVVMRVAEQLEFTEV